MKIRSILSMVLLGGFLLASMPVDAQRVSYMKRKEKASQRFADSESVARVKNKSQNQIYHGIVATLSGIYYSGDIIKPAEALKYGAIPDQFGASLTLNYKMTLNVYVSMRFGVQGGLLRGSNKKVFDSGSISSRHEFNSVFAEPFVGVEVYPILNYGFFIYGGLGLTGSIIDYKHQRRSQTYTAEKWFGIVPMAQFGLGYNWFISRDWTLGIELMGQIGFFDGQRFGLDGWPNKNAFDLNSGDINRQQEEQQKYKEAKGPDGWLQLGFVISYHF